MHRWSALSVFLGTAFGQNAGGIAFFENRIRPLLAENCYGCHSSELTQPTGGASGALAVVPGQPEAQTRRGPAASRRYRCLPAQLHPL
jgi:hypothetical protein